LLTDRVKETLELVSTGIELLLCCLNFIGEEHFIIVPINIYSINSPAILNLILTYFNPIQYLMNYTFYQSCLNAAILSRLL
jgi:hypothetical protein